MLFVLFAIIFVYILITFFGHAVHWTLHQPWSGRLYKAHMTHHLKLYPPPDYMSKDKYRGAGEDNTLYTFAIASLPLLATPIMLSFLGILSIPLTITLIVEMLLIGFLHDYIHDAFHVSNHWLNRFKRVREWGQIHFVHHVDLSKNLGIFTFWTDKLFGSFQKKL